MEKIQEYLLRGFIAVVMSAMFMAAIVGVAVMTFTGTRPSNSFDLGIGVLTAAALFFLPSTRDTAREWANEMTNREIRRKAHKNDRILLTKKGQKEAASRKEQTT